MNTTTNTTPGTVGQDGDAAVTGTGKGLSIAKRPPAPRSGPTSTNKGRRWTSCPKPGPIYFTAATNRPAGQKKGVTR